MAKTPSRFGAARARWADRLARSSRVFLAGLIIACGIEVMVDWNQTFFEINVLRDQVREKATSYAGLLERAAVEPMQGHDVAALDTLAAGVLDDEDAVYVRITDPRGEVIYEKLKADYGAAYAKKRGETFTTHYARLVDRDVRGILNDPAGFRRRLANSRYRDFAQVWTDTTARAVSLFVPPKPPPPARANLVYQDRLRDTNRERDDAVTWAIAPLEKDGAKLGAVLVAFDMTRTNDGIRLKYFKGFGMVVFFVGLILVQSTINRRDKLRILDLEARYASAKKALRAALPQGPVRVGGLVASGALEQAKGPVDGMIWDACDDRGAMVVLVVDPDGDGIDAAAIGLHMARTFRARCAAGTPVDLDAEVRALGAATADIPLTRPIGVLLARVTQDGAVEARVSRFASLHVLDGASVAALPAHDADAEPAEGIVPPIARAEGVLPAHATLVCACSGKGQKEARLDGEALARYALRTRGPAGEVTAEDAAIWARGKHAALAENDVVVVTVQRT